MVIFVRVAETRSFAAAASRSGISPPAVSRSIARLEKKLGVRLFQRSTRRVAMTAEGDLFLERCRRILDELTAAERELVDAAAEPTGRLRISLPMVSGLMEPVLSAFAERYPKIEMDVDFSDRLVDVIGEGFDAVVRTGDGADPRLINRVLGESRFVYVATPDYLARHGTPVQPADLARHACLLYRFPTTGQLQKWPLRPNGEGADIRLSPRMSCGNIEVLLHMALRGLGIACLSDFAVQSALARGDLVSILDEWSDPDGAIAFRVLWPNRQVLPKLRAFIDFMADNLFPARR
jgi:DNA-binding transcriptional LysR family regulator